jgi:exosortase/archaeosortase family protein
LQLQLTVTDGVLTSLHWLGIPATKTGNVIELARTSVGVEEACSGVRSLLSCVFAGLFFSATLVRRAWSRTGLLLLAAPLAVAMNFLRSLLLTLLAHRGVNISGAWHDVTGFAILGLTAALLGALALGLARAEGGRPAALPAAPASGARWPRRDFVLLSGGLLLGLIAAGFFAAVTRPADGQGVAPDLTAVLPAQASGWDHVAEDDMYPYAAALQTDHLAQRTYLRRDATGVTQLTIYLAYWPPGEVPVSHVASHTPDICWPGAGWQLQPGEEGRPRLIVAGASPLPPAEFRHFASVHGPQFVWFWHIYGRRVIESPNALSPLDLLQSVLHFGIRSRGEQLFVRVSSNRPWAAVQDDPLVHQVFAGLAAYGL